jgi:uroporphyrinogen-III synthase
MVEARAGLSGRWVAVFESRYGRELANLVQKQGGIPLVAPAIAEVPLSLGPELMQFAEALRRGDIDVFVVLTGAGNKKLAEVLEPVMPRTELGELLSRTLVVARGPKSVAALRELGVKPKLSAPEPHTYRDLFDVLAASCALSGKRVAIQQYGVPHGRLTALLEAEGAHVMQVPVYRWQLPEDVSGLEAQIEAIVRGEVEVLLFTAGPQAGSMLEVATQLGKERALRRALSLVAVGSVGPSCSEALRGLSIEPDFEPEHGKMGHLVLEAARRVADILETKRQTAQPRDA